MAIETATQLKSETVSELQDLVQVNIDSRDGFKEVAEKTQNLKLQNLFLSLAAERDRQAEELLMHVERNDSEHRAEGSFSAKLHRCWINTRAAMSSDDTQVILDEAERGEDVIKEAYESALKETAGSAVNDVLMSHMTRVKASHDKIRDMRDAHREANKS